MQIARKADIATMQEPSNGTIYGNITFNAGAGWVPWEVTLTPRLSSTDQLTREGLNMGKSVDFIIAKDRPGLRHMLQLMERDEFILLIKDGSGRNKIVGQLHAPMRFSFRHDTGQLGDRNQYQCRFYFTGPDNEYFYNGTVAEPPVGPPPCLVKWKYPGQTDEQAALVAVLTPGTTMIITSEFGYQDFHIDNV